MFGGKSWSLVLKLLDPKEGASVHTDSRRVCFGFLSYLHYSPFQKQKLSPSSLKSSGTLSLTRVLETLDLVL